ncbi:MAG: hypothetical protein WC205_02575 [Opitutaceae bacterium]|jgi:hypothetical protein
MKPRAKISPARIHSRQRARGFALLITVTLLAFLVLLLVSLASLTRVETQVASNNQTLSSGRANALLALNIALGQLQKYAGPDKAATARADITVAAINQPYLTGVWKSGNVAPTPDVWLVSGNETTGTTNTPAADISGNAAAVLLVDQAAGGVASLQVRALKQAVTTSSIPGLSGSQTIGHFAYWVGDEGVKASTSLINPTLGSSPLAYDNTDTAGGTGLGDNWTSDTVKRVRLDQMQLARPRLEKLFTSFDPDGSAGLAGLPKVENFSQLLLMSDSPTAAQLKAQFHNLTPLSRAVLADIANGRLKKDLSDITTPPDPAIGRFLQTRVTAGGVNTYSGYYNPVAPASSSATAWPLYSLGPVMDMMGIQFQFYISSADNKVHYSYTVSAELWNPYSAELRLLASQPLTLDVGGLPAFTVKTDGATDITFTPVIPTLTVPSATTWKPGEFKTFKGGASLGTSASPGATFDGVVPGAPDDPAATVVTITFPGTSAFNGVLKVNGSVLATYTPPNTHAGASTTTYSGNPATPPTNGKAAAATGWMLGYGFQFIDNLRTTTSKLDLNVYEKSFDPRKPVMNGYHYQPGSTTWNRDDPAQNTSTSPFPSGTYSVGATIVLFDLPRQEIVSLGMLSHVIGDQPYAFGNSWGDTANALFDEYHVSTVPRYASTWTPESALPLPNRYVEVYHPAGTASIPSADLRSSANSARYLLQKGAFNINSTSVDAWKTVLGSKLSGWTYTSNPTTGATATASLDNVFFRSPHGAQQLSTRPPVNGTDLDGNTASAGSGRQLTDNEVADLATRIVAQIQAQQRPYATLKEFVNSGALQAAIDATTINSTLSTGRKYAPGGLTQADIIRQIAPFMTARSDTFLIRAYGDTQNPATGSVDGRAWCEAVVQRLPDLVGAPSAAIADVISPNTATYPLGRQFKIISFRWLSASDI